MREKYKITRPPCSQLQVAQYWRGCSRHTIYNWRRKGKSFPPWTPFPGRSWGGAVTNWHPPRWWSSSPWSCIWPCRRPAWFWRRPRPSGGGCGTGPACGCRSCSPWSGKCGFFSFGREYEKLHSCLKGISNIDNSLRLSISLWHPPLVVAFLCWRVAPSLLLYNTL